MDPDNERVSQPRFASTLPVLLSAFLTHLQVEGRSIRTREWYTGIITRLRLYAGDAAPDRQALFTYLRELSTSVAHATYLGHLRAMRAFFKWCEREGLITPSPMTGVRIPQAPRVSPHRIYERADVFKLMAQCNRRSLWGARDYVLLHLLYDCGLRAGEACRLRRGDVNLERRFVRVLGKRGKERVVAFSQQTARLLLAWCRRAQIRSPDDYLFPSRKSAHLNPDSLWGRVKRYVDRAGITGVKGLVHALRHSFATHAFERGADLAAIKEDLGHERYETVEQYRHLTIDARRAAHDRYTPIESD